MTSCALICGSLAFDTIMVFKDRFARHILPQQVHILNVAFLVPELRREFGGCAGNIAYTLNLLQAGAAVPMGTVGEDFAPYHAWLQENGIDCRHLLTVEGTYTAQAYITTDLDDNQITAFHPGAMNYAQRNRVNACPQARIGIVAPDGRDGMVEHAQQFAAAGVPFIFDPGQGTPMFNGEELLTFIDQANWLAFNDYEAQLVQERTGLTLKQLAQRADAVIVTRGGKGSEIIAGGKHYVIPVAAVSAPVDPTGCGDAYRAGLLYGLLHELDWETTGRIASLLGAIKVESAGTQNHRLDPDGFADRFHASFGYRW